MNKVTLWGILFIILILSLFWLIRPDKEITGDTETQEPLHNIQQAEPVTETNNITQAKSADHIAVTERIEMTALLPNNQ